MLPPVRGSGHSCPPKAAGASTVARRHRQWEATLQLVPEELRELFFFLAPRVLNPHRLIQQVKRLPEILNKELRGTTEIRGHLHSRCQCASKLLREQRGCGRTVPDLEEQWRHLVEPGGGH